MADDTTSLLNKDSPADPATENRFYQNADSQRPVSNGFFVFFSYSLK